LRKLQSLAALLLIASSNIEAGCIGPIIMGKCHGKAVSWDTVGQGTDVRRPESDLKLAPQYEDPDQIPPPSLPSQRAPEHGLDRVYRHDPQDARPLEPQEYQGRFR